LDVAHQSLSLSERLSHHLLTLRALRKLHRLSRQSLSLSHHLLTLWTLCEGGGLSHHLLGLRALRSVLCKGLQEARTAFLGERTGLGKELPFGLLREVFGEKAACLRA
jgi:hypothetical protein